MLTFSNDIKIKLLLLELNPYPALLRLLDHPDEFVVRRAISSIYNLLLADTNSTPSNTQHPHFEVMQTLNGI